MNATAIPKSYHFKALQAVCAEKILAYVNGVESDGWVNLTDMARHPSFIGVHFDRIMITAERLAAGHFIEQRRDPETGADQYRRFVGERWFK